MTEPTETDADPEKGALVRVWWSNPAHTAAQAEALRAAGEVRGEYVYLWRAELTALRERLGRPEPRRGATWAGMARGVAQAVGQAVTRAAAGEAVWAGRATAAERLAVCQKCDELGKGGGPGRCGLCRCYMPMKTRLAGAWCPAGKW